jgi:hypothetical protein
MSSPTPQAPHLFALPAELQKDIYELLPFPTLQVLCATHPHFRNFIDLKALRDEHLTWTGGETEIAIPESSLIEELHVANEYDTFFSKLNLRPCSYCLRLRTCLRFSKAHLEERGRYTSYCIDCGLEPAYRIYKPGTRIDTLGQSGVFCAKCYMFQRGIHAKQVLGYSHLCWGCGLSSRVQKGKDDAAGWKRKADGDFLDSGSQTEANHREILLALRERGHLARWR